MSQKYHGSLDDKNDYFGKEKKGDLTQTYDENPYTNREVRKPMDNTKTPPKTSITQRLRTDLGRSVGVTAVIQLCG